MSGNTSKPRILLVEDDLIVGEVIALALKDANYEVDWEKDGTRAAERICKREHQALLLDLGLPGRDGIELLASLREDGNAVPVIIISGRDSPEGRIDALNLGADDYLLKPFHPTEMLARLRAVLRRGGGQPRQVLSNGIISLDLVTHEARRDEASYVLSVKEFELLRALLLRPGAVLTRFELEKRLYSDKKEEVGSNAVDFLIHGIRKKLGAEVIENVRGSGWKVARQK
jgi:two-component system OmpR family response regulator